MRIALLNERLSGKTLQRPIFSSAGTIFISAGVKLTPAIINRLTGMGFTTVYVDDDLASDVQVDEVMDIPTQTGLITGLKEIFAKVAEDNAFDDERVKALAKSLLTNAQISGSSLVELGGMGQVERSIQSHSLNVAVLSLTVGTSMGLNYDQLFNLTLGALLHDLGKAIKDGPDHPRVGFDLIRQYHSISVFSAHCALSHHEHVNGKGFPRQAKGEEIVLPARILALCDYYENAVNRVEKPMLPHEAQEAVAALTGTRFDVEVYSHFRKSVCVYPNGLPVKLTTGDSGVVVRQNSNFPLRPIVKVQSLKGPLDVDLLKELTVFIDKVALA